MKEWQKRAIYISGALLLALALCWCVMRFGFRFDPLAKHGWSGQQYLDGTGVPLTGWQTLAQERYYFDPANGNKTVGWRILNGRHYCFDETGKLRTGWYCDGTDTYLFGPDGVACTGLVQTDRGIRLFGDDGRLQVGVHSTEAGTWHFGADGAPVSGWYSADDATYFFGADGKALTGWQELEGSICYFGADGAAADGWMNLDGCRYYFEQGKMHTGWLDDGTNRYYLREDGTMAIGEEVIDGVSRFFTSKGKYVVLVNAWHAVPEDYTMELVKVEGFEFDITGSDALQQMLAACREAGYQCYINNTYRSVYTQQRLRDRRMREYQERGMSYYEADYIINQSIMTPGHSEHHLGLAVDLHGSDAMFEWLGEHCWEFGFILRYPEGKYDKTGIIYEPWHFRYVGTELALELGESGLCLEEYMEQISMSTTEEQP